MTGSSPVSARLAIVLGVAVLSTALLPWLLGVGTAPPAKSEPADPPVRAPATPEAKPANVPPPPPTPLPEPAPKPVRVEPPAPAAPEETPAAPPPSDAPEIDLLHRSLVSLGSDYPSVDALLGAIADVLRDRPPAKVGEAGMNKVELILRDPERTAKVYALSVGNRGDETYDVTLDVAHGPLPAELRDRFRRLLNCRLFIDVKGDGTPPTVRGSVRFEPVADEIRIGGPYLCGYSIGSIENSQRYVPFMAEVVRETDGTIGYRTRADDALAMELPVAESTRLVDVLRVAFEK